MTPVEIMATILGLSVLLKLSLFALSPKSMASLVEKKMKLVSKFGLLYLLLGLAAGYFLLKEITIVQFSASLFVASIIMGSLLLEFPEKMLEMYKTFVKEGIFGRFLLHYIVWAGIGLWTLYALFA